MNALCGTVRFYLIDSYVSDRDFYARPCMSAFIRNKLTKEIVFHANIVVNIFFISQN